MESRFTRIRGTDPDTVAGAADGCAALIHLAATVTESPPEATFQAVNVEGTRKMLQEAERAGVSRFIYASSLGADRGKSPYHISKRVGEELALASALNTTVVRLANVYGPGDQVISLLIKMIRMLPVVRRSTVARTYFSPFGSAMPRPRWPRRSSVPISISEPSISPGRTKRV